MTSASSWGNTGGGSLRKKKVSHAYHPKKGHHRSGGKAANLETRSSIKPSEQPGVGRPPKGGGEVKKKKRGKAFQFSIWGTPHRGKRHPHGEKKKKKTGIKIFFSFQRAAHEVQRKVSQKEEGVRILEVF